MKRLLVEVPATSANLGPGFDTLGLALNIVDTVQVELQDGDKDVVLCNVAGEDIDQLDPRENLICRAYRAWAEDTGANLPGARFSLQSRIPVGKGLGSSAASIVAGLSAATKAAHAENARSRALSLAARLEGHADNVAAAMYGGLVTTFLDGDSVRALHVANHLSLGIALFVPQEPLPTDETRAGLPRSVAMADAVFDLGRLAYLTTALIWGKWELIGPAMQDRLHQPYRGRLLPALDAVIAAALEGGAHGAALSGGGPTVIALGPMAEAGHFAAAMESRATECGWVGKSLVTQVRHLGVQIKEE
jgi:homoserine kinase